jgi:hypothetical protein
MRAVERFLVGATSLLTGAQRLCIVLHVIDSAAADGAALTPVELVFMLQFQHAFAISPPNRFRPMFHAVAATNDRTVLFRANHPRNRGRQHGRTRAAVAATPIH